MNKKDISLNNIISRNRSFLMGIAIIWIALYHLPNHSSIPVIGFLQNIGYGGTDIFIMLSGFGAYYSLSKDSDAFNFLKRRLLRLLPSYLPFIVLWMIVHKIILRLYFTEICGNLTMTGWWNGDENQFNWFIDCIIIFYLLSPYIFKAITTTKNSSLTLAALLMVSLLIGCSFMHGVQIIAVSRLPIFIIGFGIAHIKNKITDSAYVPIIWNSLMLAGFLLLYWLMHQTLIDLWHYGMYWYPFVLITPGLCLDLALLGDLLKKSVPFNGIHTLISTIGTASFEVFMLHIFIFENFMILYTTNALGWLGLFIVSFLLGIGYHHVISKIKLK